MKAAVSRGRSHPLGRSRWCVGTVLLDNRFGDRAAGAAGTFGSARELLLSPDVLQRLARPQFDPRRRRAVLPHTRWRPPPPAAPPTCPGSSGRGVCILKA